MTDEESDKASAERLAEEIRRGVRAVIPRAEEESPEYLPALRAWDEAERFVVPAVPAGASLSRIKGLMLRVLRLVTRSQGSFNMKVLEGTKALDRSLAILRREFDDAERRLSRTTELLQARMQTYENPASAGKAGARGGSSPLPGALSTTSSGGLSAQVSGGLSAPLSDGFYVRFEEEFRGSEEAIRERQGGYVGFFRDAPGPVLDCGCGRGEFVEILAAAGIPASGVDANRVAITLGRNRGVAIEAGDAFERLRSLRGGLGGICALQFVEHLAPGSVAEFLGLAFEALAPGGRLLLETINPDSLYAMRAYRLDPTHAWPVPARTLSLLVREAGFREKEVRFVSPVPASEALAETGENERKLNRWIFGFQDYALFAERPEA
jgi:O-antigen chain-terminating methyltransferase